METAKIAEPISGDKLYQRRARHALPLLVRQAQAAQPILYSELASELGMPNPRNLNYVLGSIGQALKALSKQWRDEVPPIQCLVINKHTGLPGEGIGWFITDKEDFRKFPRSQQRRLVEAELQKVFGYRRWAEVLKVFGLKAVQQAFHEIVARATAFRAGGESEAHRKLKAHVARSPHLVDLPRPLAGRQEYALPSGDSVDVLFQHGDDWVAVEVKPAASPEPDLVRGVFQCVKYRAVIEAHQAAQGLPRSVRAVLVLGGTLPSELVPLKNVLGVQVVDRVEPR